MLKSLFFNALVATFFLTALVMVVFFALKKLSWLRGHLYRLQRKRNGRVLSPLYRMGYLMSDKKNKKSNRKGLP